MSENKITGNEPMYPISDINEIHQSIDYGLTIRQHFAAMAMQGLMSNHLMIDTFSDNAYKMIADEAVKLADALITSLNKTK